MRGGGRRAQPQGERRRGAGPTPERARGRGAERWLSPQVSISRRGTVSGYGLLAAADLEPGELLFSVPRSALLSQHTCAIRALLHDGERRAGPPGTPLCCVSSVSGAGNGTASGVLCFVREWGCGRARGAVLLRAPRWEKLLFQGTARPEARFSAGRKSVWFHARG